MYIWKKEYTKVRQSMLTICDKGRQVLHVNQIKCCIKCNYSPRCPKNCIMLYDTYKIQNNKITSNEQKYWRINATNKKTGFALPHKTPFCFLNSMLSNYVFVIVYIYINTPFCRSIFIFCKLFCIAATSLSTTFYLL